MKHGLLGLTIVCAPDLEMSWWWRIEKCAFTSINPVKKKMTSCCDWWVARIPLQDPLPFPERVLPSRRRQSKRNFLISPCQWQTISQILVVNICRATLLTGARPLLLFERQCPSEADRSKGGRGPGARNLHAEKEEEGASEDERWKVCVWKFSRWLMKTWVEIAFRATAKADAESSLSIGIRLFPGPSPGRRPPHPSPQGSINFPLPISRRERLPPGIIFNLAFARLQNISAENGFLFLAGNFRIWNFSVPSLFLSPPPPSLSFFLPILKVVAAINFTYLRTTPKNHLLTRSRMIESCKEDPIIFSWKRKQYFFHPECGCLLQEGWKLPCAGVSSPVGCLFDFLIDLSAPCLFSPTFPIQFLANSTALEFSVWKISSLLLREDLPAGPLSAVAIRANNFGLNARRMRNVCPENILFSYCIYHSEWVFGYTGEPYSLSSIIITFLHLFLHQKFAVTCSHVDVWHVHFSLSAHTKKITKWIHSQLKFGLKSNIPSKK